MLSNKQRQKLVAKPLRDMHHKWLHHDLRWINFGMSMAVQNGDRKTTAHQQAKAAPAHTAPTPKAQTHTAHGHVGRNVRKAAQQLSQGQWADWIEKHENQILAPVKREHGDLKPVVPK
mmetsp:Transcript_66418/g.156815  ORF Transcript_66418/g.156815 Transcript_66418/m.156815 type:complete len:118 (+) Transcript_66418:162-515(+)